MDEQCKMHAVAVSEDGNCLFNALSVVVACDESLSNELWVLTAIKMINFKDLYVTQLTARFVHNVSPYYDDSCLDCTRLGNFSSAWTIQVETTVLKREISCSYLSTSEWCIG